MSIAYLDPGNIESDLQAGAVAGYRVSSHCVGVYTLTPFCCPLTSPHFPGCPLTSLAAAAVGAVVVHCYGARPPGEWWSGVAMATIS